MSSTQTTKGRIAIVKDELRAGVPRHAIIEKWYQQFHIMRRSVDRIITKANMELAEEAREREEIESAVRREEITKQAKERVMMEIEVDALLSDILRGTRKNEKLVRTSSGHEAMTVAAPVSDMLKAINAFYKRLPPKYYTTINKDGDICYKKSIFVEEEQPARKSASSLLKEMGLPPI